MAALLGIGLVALEVVYRGGNGVSRFLPGHTAWTVCPTAMSVWKGTIVS